MNRPHFSSGRQWLEFVVRMINIVYLLFFISIIFLAFSIFIKYTLFNVPYRLSSHSCVNSQILILHMYPNSFRRISQSKFHIEMNDFYMQIVIPWYKNEWSSSKKKNNHTFDLYFCEKQKHYITVKLCYICFFSL